MTDEKPPPPPRQGGNRSMSKEEMEGAFGPHPFQDWKYKPPKKGRPWWKQPPEER